MQKTTRFLYWLFPLLVIAVLTLVYVDHLGDTWRSLVSRFQAWIPSQPATPPAEPPAGRGGDAATQPTVRQPVPTAAPADTPADDAAKASARPENALPPSPPLPQVPPEASQAERHTAFGLFKSVDYIVLRDEPFEVAGQQWTVRRMQTDLLGIGNFQPVVPAIEENAIGSSVRKSINAPQSLAAHRIYYGIRVVRPHESLWGIHYAILREYLARRQIDIPANADQPLSDGRSSGVGRVLKFFEGIVSIYDFKDVHAKLDIDEIRPHSMIVFFRISDVFNALDQVRAEDINRLRFIGDMLRLVHPEQGRDLVNRKSLLEVPADQ
ncbi:MAG: hypothetical protein ABFD98_19530 [Syntrophobacteraceae bacterium]|nr:hypothetical protein [Desulfobacteraceae bacterium]